MVETFFSILQISFLLAAAGWIGLASLGRLPGSPVPSVAGLLKRESHRRTPGRFPG